jgi:GNAT superfamily N-acetyltransferase
MCVVGVILGIFVNLGFKNMIEIVKLDKSNIKEASKLADRIFYYEEIMPSVAFEASLDNEKFKKLVDLASKNNIEPISLEYWVAKNLDNVVVGTTGLYLDKADVDDGIIWLGWFCVDPNFRNKGIGKKILEFTIQEARSKGKKILRLYTSTDPREKDAQKIYDRLGFRVTNEKVEKKFENYKTIFKEIVL